MLAELTDAKLADLLVGRKVGKMAGLMVAMRASKTGA